MHYHNYDSAFTNLGLLISKMALVFLYHIKFFSMTNGEISWNTIIEHTCI